MIEIDKTPIECDVLVAGGGIGGLMAAIGAAREGARVVIAEKAHTKRSGAGATGIGGVKPAAPEPGDPARCRLWASSASSPISTMVSWRCTPR